MYHDNGEQDSRLLFVGPTAQAIHEAQRRCMVEDVAAVLARQFDKDKVGEVTALVNDLFDRDWKEKASQQKRSEDTRLNSSHTVISYAVFCLKKKKHNDVENQNSK